jgi:hypothetical protein
MTEPTGVASTPGGDVGRETEVAALADGDASDGRGEVTEDPEKAEPDIGAVLVIDDSVSGLLEPWFESDDSWNGFVGSLREPVETAADAIRVEQLYAGEDRRASLDEIQALVGREAFGASLREYDQGQNVLKRWIDALTARGGTVTTASGMSDLKTMAPDGDVDAFLRSFALILLDYEFVTNDAGAASTDLAKFIARAVRKGEPVNPPLLLKFSRVPVENRDEDLAEFSEKVDYPRGCYHFLDKSVIYDERVFGALLDGLLQDAEFARRLYRVARSVGSSISRQIADHVAEILAERLDPTAIRLMFSGRLRTEGMSELDYLIELTTNAIVNKVRVSEQVVVEMQSFLQELESVPWQGLPADSSGLAYLQVALRFDRDVNKFRRPIDFGDIFEFDNGRNDGVQTVGIVLSQQCDLMVRGETRSEGLGRSRPGDWVSLCIGELRTDRGAVDGRFSETGMRPYKYLNWHEDELVSMPRPVLDLVSLSDDGRARLLDIQPQSAWWTGAYTQFVRDQVDRVRKATVTEKAGRKTTRRIRLGGSLEPAALGLTALGLGVDISIESDGQLGFRRVCRMRWAETLALQHRVTAKATRIGLGVSVGDAVTDEPVRVQDERGRFLGETLGHVTSLDDNVISVDVEWSLLRQVTANSRRYDDLAVGTARSPGRFNLMAVPDLGYTLEAKTENRQRRWLLKPKSDDEQATPVASSIAGTVVAAAS